MKKNGFKIRIINLIAVMLHIARFVLGCVAIIGFFGEAEGSVWPTQFIALSCAVAAVIMIYLMGKVINWIDKASDRLIHE